MLSKSLHDRIELFLDTILENGVEIPKEVKEKPVEFIGSYAGKKFKIWMEVFEGSLEDNEKCYIGIQESPTIKVTKISEDNVKVKLEADAGGSCVLSDGFYLNSLSDLEDILRCFIFSKLF